MRILRMIDNLDCEWKALLTVSMIFDCERWRIMIDESGLRRKRRSIRESGMIKQDPGWSAL